jgi:hypothetical protein
MQRKRTTTAMTKAVRAGGAIGLALLLLFAGNAVRARQASSGPSAILGIDLTSAEGPAAGKVFYISGHLFGLYPGRHTHLHLEVQNPNAEGMTVNTITITPTGTNTAGCTATAQNIRVTNYTGPGFFVPANGSATIDQPIWMPVGVADACKAAVFILKYSGTATQASASAGTTSP